MTKEFFQDDGDIKFRWILGPDHLIYKGHVGDFTVDIDAEVISGYLAFLPYTICEETGELISPLITFQGTTAKEAELNFQHAVEQYIAGYATTQTWKDSHSSISYRGYTGWLEVDMDNRVIYGYAIDIHDSATLFAASTVTEAKQQFQASVDSYLMFYRST
jgi:hypothetical protein